MKPGDPIFQQLSTVGTMGSAVTYDILKEAWERQSRSYARISKVPIIPRLTVRAAMATKIVNALNAGVITTSQDGNVGTIPPKVTRAFLAMISE